jgi:cob(I)alamin adenosyltransferase
MLEAPGKTEIDKDGADLPVTHFVLLKEDNTTHVTLSYSTLCRRAERLAVHLNHNEPNAEIAITY